MPCAQVKTTGAPYARCCGLVHTRPSVDPDSTSQAANVLRPAFQVGLFLRTIYVPPMLHQLLILVASCLGQLKDMTCHSQA